MLPGDGDEFGTGTTGAAVEGAAAAPLLCCGDCLGGSSAPPNKDEMTKGNIMYQYFLRKDC